MESLFHAVGTVSARIAAISLSLYRLMANDVAFAHGWHIAVEQVQIGATNRWQNNPQNRILGVEEGRVGNRSVRSRYNIALSCFSSASAHSDVGFLPDFCSLFRPDGCPSMVAISPVSSDYLNRRRSCLIICSKAGLNSFITIPSNCPAGGRYWITTWTSVPWPLGA